ncbi:MAG: DNA mismatch repair endonuclease MutL [Planctomycetia bacterium]|nr:DNA mismatch repair endonuclease MutL [Planctomycetia bacterium]
MPRIHQLPSSVVTKIAAGEVIERPASVVKELLENSVDAGSSRIDVEVEQGGVELLRVVDDGCGIVAEDLPLAFASHATSKLHSADDLFRIGTLGFRGEALASIGGVAQVTLQSRPAGQGEGAELTCHGGVLSEVRPWNGSPGTRLEVRHLFFNTPVRRKFLRTTPTELGHVTEQFTRIALSHPALQLTLRHHGKLVYDVPRSAGLVDRIGLFFGREVRDQLYELKTEAGPARLTGFIGDPACERGNAKMQYFFLNGRCIRDRTLTHALQEAYRGLLMVGRYAVAFLFLELPPDAVDVNVHPTKSEVRFRDSQAVCHLVLKSIRERLQRQNLMPKLQLGSSVVGGQGPGVSGQASAGGLFAAPAAPNWTLQPPPMSSTRLPFGTSAAAGAQPAPLTPENELDASDADASSSVPGAESSTTDNSQLTTDQAPLTKYPLPGSKFLQVHDAYLVMETPEGMLVIDQHALHERILFEQLKRRIRAGELEKQRLLIPEPIDLSADHAARVLDQREALAGLGLEVEDFGGGTVLLTSYPAILGRKSPVEILQAVVDHLTTQDRAPNREQLLNDLLAVMACRAAVKAGDRLTTEEIAALIAMRELAEDSHHCPHGRPTTLLVSRQELDRQFRRT